MNDDIVALLKRTPLPDGLPVLACIPGSGAAGAGIEPGDLLMQVNGVDVRSVDDYVRARALDKTVMLVKLKRASEIIERLIPLSSSTGPAINARALSDEPPRPS